MLFDSISSMWRHLRALEVSVSSQERRGKAGDGLGVSVGEGGGAR